MPDSLTEIRNRLTILEETVQMLLDFIAEREVCNLKAEIDKNGDVIFRRPKGLN